jgi:hypothetical protein
LPHHCLICQHNNLTPPSLESLHFWRLVSLVLQV